MAKIRTDKLPRVDIALSPEIRLTLCPDDRMRAEEKARMHKEMLEALVGAQKKVGRNYVFELEDGRKVEIEQVGYGALDTLTGTVREIPGRTGSLWVRLRVDGKYTNGDGWYGFTNPPLKVPDGTKREEADPITGVRRQVDNFKTDVRAALLAMLERVL